MEDGAEDGVGHGQATARSAICRHGRGLAGYTVEGPVAGYMDPGGIGGPMALGL